MEQGVALVTTRIEQETEYVGRRIGEMLEGPMVVALQGELGSGKTVFVRGAAKGLAVEQAVTSPTFILLKVYQGRLPVYHFDFYRLEEPEELDYLGFEEYLPGDGVAFVEWAERFPDILPDQRLDVSIERFYDRSGKRKFF
jgi:tRNA threonylcarbamoyladenosine biosynthesis protein TsaE